MTIAVARPKLSPDHQVCFNSFHCSRMIYLLAREVAPVYSTIRLTLSYEVNIVPIKSQHNSSGPLTRMLLKVMI